MISVGTVLTLLFVAVGGFVTLVGIVLMTVCVSVLHEAHGAEAAPAVVLVLPIGVLLVGGLLVFTGARLARANTG